jgi:glycosyltransferase involved in cell wall biosynthesis
MERIPQSPPIIPPLLDKGPRPFWSVMIPAYNCTRFLKEAIENVLMQDMGEELMQIEIVDDCSTDADVENLVQLLGKGRVKYFRQKENVGSLRNFETCINRAKGEWVHIHHGDDRVKNGFYKKYTDTIKKYPDAGMLFSGYSNIDENGKIKTNHIFQQSQEGYLENAFFTIAKGIYIQFICTVVKREVYEKLGSFYGMIAGEDWEMWVRIAKNYPVVFIPEMTADYRRYEGTISWPKKENGKYARELAKATLIIESTLPKKDRKIMKATRRRRSKSSLSIALFIWGYYREINLVNDMVVLAFKLSPTSTEIYLRIFRLYFKILRDSIFRKKMEIDVSGT